MGECPQYAKSDLYKLKVIVTIRGKENGAFADRLSYVRLFEGYIFSQEPQEFQELSNLPKVIAKVWQSLN